MSKFNRQILLFAILVVPFIHGTSQISFTNSNFLIPDYTFHSGVGLGISDVDGDGLSDIIHLEQGRDLHISYQQLSGAFITTEYISMANSSQWSMCAADINNDGLLDILSGGVYDGVKLSIADGDGNYTETIQMPGEDIFTQGSNFADINNDGFVDVFVCHDDAMSKIYGNNGDGTFTEQNWIDMTTVPASDNSGNYGSVWSDFDNDGDLDLYIAKCRQGVGNPEDPRRINALYVNDGNGNFSEQAEEYGLKIGAQSWTADFGDMDNDGDFDCFITNHDTDSQILENDGTGHFTDITSQTGIDIGGLPIQGIWKDFDNDGFMDIIVAGSQHSIWRNNGDKTFTEIEVFNNNQMESFAVGDLNSDGFLDVMGGYANIYTSPSNIDDVVWINDGNDNNYLSINLTGIISNKKGIGAKIKIYGPWGVQVREVRAGESYGIMNDLQQVFGLGTNETIDNLVVEWPSGIVTTISDVQANQTLNILEQDCAPIDVEISSNNTSYTICPGQSISLSGPDGFSSYEWNTGSTEQTLETFEPGVYSLQVTDDEGCIGISSNVFVSGPEQLFPVLETDSELVNCEGTEVLLTLSGAESNNADWSNGEFGVSSITISEAGTYNVTVYNQCQDAFTSEDLTFDFVTVEDPIIEPDTITLFGSYTFESNDPNTYWYDSNPPVGEPLGVGSTFESPELDVDVTYYALVAESQGIEATGGQGGVQGDPIYSGGIYNGAVIFDAYNDFTIKSVEVYTDSLGVRVIELRNEAEEVLASKTVEITETGWTELTLDFEVLEGENYLLTTNADSNNEIFGANSPYFARSNEFVSYPYLLGDLGALTSSNFGSPYYYYFYNWKVKSIADDCYSDVVEVNGVFDPVINTNAVSKDFGISIYPVPASDVLNYKLDNTTQKVIQIQIVDLNGKILKKEYNPEDGTINIGNIPSGVYHLEFILENQSIIQKRFIKG